MPNRDIKQLESKTQRQIIEYLDTIPNLYFFKVLTANMRGVPDIIACYKGRFIGLEVKSSLNKATAIQCWNIGEILGAGGIGKIVRSVDDVKRILDEVGHE